MNVVKLWLTAALLSSLFVAFFILIGPVWQIHDDAYYAMLADGYGMLSVPVEVLPYMHPFVGTAVSKLRALGAPFSYATYLYLCIFLVTAAFSYRILTDKSWLHTILFVAAGIAPVALLPQYTVLAGLLVAGAAVLWVREGSGAPTVLEWVLGGLLILLAAYFRSNMALLAALLLLPVVAWDGLLVHRHGRVWFFAFTLTLIGVLGIFAISTIWLSDHRLIEFYHLNNPMGQVMNYGYLSAIRGLGLALPEGYSENDINLLALWFFGELALIEPEQMRAIVDNITFLDVLKARYWESIAYVKALPSGLSLWFVLATLWVTFFSRLRTALWLGFILFIASAVLSAIILKPFPERVSLGVVVGFFIFSALTPRVTQGNERPLSGRTMNYIGLIFLIPVAFNMVTDRLILRDQTEDWVQDSRLLYSEPKVYAFANSINLRAGFRPFDIVASPPNIVFLGSMYLLPQVQDLEKAMGCGGFVGCLAAGGRIVVTGSEVGIDRLVKLVWERYQIRVYVNRKTATKSFTVFYLSTKS